MSFADKYLEKHKCYPDLISDPPLKELNYIIVIPAYDEPDVISSLESLFACYRPSKPVEIIIVINSSADSQENILNQNKKTLKDIKDWLKFRREDKFKVHIIHIPDIPPKYAGAGMARKIGMDEAIARFNHIENDTGIVLSFDADSVCDQDY